MNKYIRGAFISTVSLLAIISLASTKAEAKIASANKTDSFINNPINGQPSVLSAYTTLNQNGTMIYDADAVQQQSVINDAASHWNDAVGIKIIMSYQKGRC